MGYVLSGLGILILAGTAGAADQSLVMPLGRIIIGGILGLACMGLGLLLLLSEDQNG